MGDPEVSPLAAPFTTMLVCTRVGVDPVTGNIWQLQGTRGMVNIGNIPAPPANTAAPVASGSTVHGSSLSCTSGSWSPVGAYSYQWYSGGVSTGSAGAGPGYLTTASDVGNMMTCVVTASNAGGAVSATSNALGPIT